MTEKCTILLVEDEAAHAKLIERAFLSFDQEFDIHLEMTLGECKKWLSQNSPDILISDFVLPDGKGTNLLPGVGKDPHYPIILMTSQGDETIAVQSMKAGAADYIVKSEENFRQLPKITMRVLREWNLIVENKKAQEQLRESEARFRTLFDSSAMGIAVVGLDGHITDCNRTFRQLIKYSANELRNRHINTVTHPDDASNDVDDFFQRRNIADTSVYRSEKRLVQKGGDPIRVRLTANYVRDDKGDTIFALVVVEDIQERFLAQQKLEHAQALLGAAIEQSPAGILVADAPDVRIRVANSAALEIGGYQGEDLQHTPDEYHPHHWQVLHANGTPFEFEELPLVKAVKQGKTVRNLDMVVVQPGGEKRWVLANAAPVRDREGKVIAGVVVFPDVSEMRKTEHALLKTEERYARALSAIDDGIWDIDLHTGKHFFSPRIHEMLGYDSDRRVENFQDLLALVHPEDAPIITQAFNKYFQDNRPDIELEFRMRAQNGDYRWNLTRGRVVEVGLDGKKRRIVGVHSDITERVKSLDEKEQLEAQLQQAQKMEAIGRLAGGIAHDFNNLLTGITGNISLVLMDIGAEDPLRESLAEIHYASERAAMLTRQLLAFSRKQVMEPKTIDLNKVVEEIQKMLTRLIGETISLTTELESDLKAIRVDVGQIEQVIVNLVVNARDAMPQGGALLIETSNVRLDAFPGKPSVKIAAGDYVCLSISDTGTGMDEETRSHVFEPFFTTKPVGKGTGLGLSTAYGIINQHKGLIHVESEVGQGTTVYVYFPCAKGKMQEPAPLRSSKIDRWPTGRETILLIEEEEVVLSMTGRVLERLGYNILKAGGSRSGLSAVEEYPDEIHLVMVDLVLSNGSGREIARRIREKLPKVKFLYSSGYSNQTITAKEADEGNIGFIGKPFTPLNLAKKVREILDR